MGTNFAGRPLASPLEWRMGGKESKGLDLSEDGYMAKHASKKKAKGGPPPGKRLYTLDVFIIDGMMMEKFLKRNRVVSRTIQIRGDQTLEDLHETIFDAFDRFDEHMYEFQFGKRPMDPKGKRYILSTPFDDWDDDKNVAGTVDATTIDALGLKVGQAFAYWFDFGDDWWHQINVLAIEDKVPRGKFPRVTKRVGKSPPQYPDLDEED